MGTKKRLNYPQMWIYCKVKGLDINAYKNLRPRVAASEAIRLNELRDSKTVIWNGKYAVITQDCARYQTYYLPLSLKGAKELGVNFWYELDGTYKVIEYHENKSIPSREEQPVVEKKGKLSKIWSIIMDYYLCRKKV